MKNSSSFKPTAPKMVIEGQVTPRTPVPAPAQLPATLLKTFIRFSIGTAVLAAEAIVHELQQAEIETRSQVWPMPTPPQAANSTQLQVVPPPQSAGQQARHFAIGVFLDIQNRFGQELSQLGQFERRTEQAAARVTEPLRASRILAPLWGRYDAAVARGKARVNRWVVVGRAEESYSRDLAQNALNRLLDKTLDEVVKNPHIQDFTQQLVQEQSLSMADEAIEEVRERTVTGDILFERLARALLRRPSRKLLMPADSAASDE